MFPPAHTAVRLLGSMLRGRHFQCLYFIPIFLNIMKVTERARKTSSSPVFSKKRSWESCPFNFMQCFHSDINGKKTIILNDFFFMCELVRACVCAWALYILWPHFHSFLCALCPSSAKAVFIFACFYLPISFISIYPLNHKKLLTVQGTKVSELIKPELILSSLLLESVSCSTLSP